MTWIPVASLADVYAARDRHRGLESESEGTPLSLFATLDGRVFAIATACPHGGHRLSRGHALDPTDIEDLAQFGAPFVSCPAHAYLYDVATGECVSSFGGGPGRCRVFATRVVGDRVYASAAETPATELGSLGHLPIETRNAIGLRSVDLALKARYGE